MAALRPWVAAALCAAALLLGGPRSAAAHAGLVAAAPGAGDTVSAPLAELRLRFSERVQTRSSRVTLTLADGRTLELELTTDPANPRVLLAAVPPLTDGEHRVEWRILSADGHPVEGNYTFTVTGFPPPVVEAAEPDPVPAPPPPAETHSRAAPAPPGAAALLRGAGVGVLATLAGLLLLLAWGGPVEDGPARRIAVTLAVLAPVLLAAHALAWSAYVLGGDGGPALELFTNTLPGRIEAVRLTLALFALWALALARRPGLALAFAVGAVAASGWTGHSAAFHPTWTVPARALHLAALAVWAGGLATLLSTSKEGNDFQALARRVSSLALAAVVLLAGTGAVQTLLFVPELRLLLGAPYGAVLLAKVAGLAALVVLGARNRFRLIPALPAAPARAALRRAVGWEFGVMALVVVASGFLAYIPVPRP